MKPTLLILAAGMGSRYGGLKQLDMLGPNNETIMDYSVDFAIQAGFGKVVFVIRKHMEQDFDRLILSKYRSKVEVGVVYQELDCLPEGFTPNPEREKPYGTAHAILMAKDTIKEPFAVINADDLYGENSFETMAQFLSQPQNEPVPRFSMIGYQLKNTLSPFGTVSRGVCKTNDQGELVQITEMTKIKQVEETIYNLADENNPVALSGNEPVSMNFWGFIPPIFKFLEEQFIEFLTENKDNIKAEFPIPTVVDQLIKNKQVKVSVLDCSAIWFGVTYQEDKPYVMEQLRKL